MKVLTVLFVCVTVAKSQTISCPDSEDIKPCVCRTETDKRLSVTCSNLNSSDELVKSVKNMGHLQVDTFTLERSSLGVLPADAFNGIKIVNLNIASCNVTRLSEDRNRPPFAGLEDSLEYLKIETSFINTAPLTSLSLSHLQKLTIIHSSGVLIPSIGNNWFESGPYGLKEMHLINTSLTILGSHAFEALEHLSSISLTGGFLTEIKRTMFPMPASYLESIALNGNKLQSLPDDIFSKMPSLEQVLLDKNALSTISEVVFAPVWSQLDYVYVYGNPIRCDENLRWIYKYRLPEHFYGFCASPENLLNKSLKNITLSDLQ